MGLDMYLYRKSYVKNWDHTEENDRHQISVMMGNKIREDIKIERISYIVEEVGYWRKFNALHDWFVQNAADGKDECQEIYISHPVLESLLGILQEVQANPHMAATLLPTTDGFFFGSQSYDEQYFDDLARTIPIIEEAIRDQSADYYYQASW